MMVEEIHQTSRRQMQISYKSKGYHPRRGSLASSASSAADNAANSLRAAHNSDADEDTVVTKDNWRALQDKADRYRALRQASSSTGGMRSGSEHSPHDDKSLEAKLGTLAWPGSDSKGGGSWADVNGGPHSGARGGQGRQGEFGAGIYSW
mmetsp:Transcript_3857/g.7972  ORF Transcript_3857/g.7972 Transcript_3857/m.7972 type:complete len:150 (+) Transcript_3857:172-621(+)